MPRLLTTEEIEAELADHPHWRRDGDAIVRSVRCDTFAAGIALVDRVAEIADHLDHHPDIDVRWTTVTFRLSTHSAGGLTARDMGLAREIDRLAP